MADGEEDLRFGLLHRLSSTLLGIASLTLLLFPGDSTGTPPQTRAISTYGRLPLAFEANYGQVDRNVKFVAHGAGYAVHLKTGETVITLPGVSTGMESAVRLKFLGANSSSQIAGEEELPGKSNYFIGANPQNWHTNIPTYATVRCRGLYPGVDLVYRGTSRQMEYDLILAAGSQPETIRLSIQGVQKLSIDPDGDLILRTRNGAIRQRKPFAYQKLESMKQPVPCRYVLKGRHHVGFVVGNYDVNKPLIIDPVLEYSSVGGVTGGYVAVDASGNAYLLNGSTVTKITPDGTGIVYTTVIGPMSPGGIAVDPSGNTYITGSAHEGFPLVNPIQPVFVGGIERTPMGGYIILPDAIVAKLNATGSAIVYSTYLGGYGWDEGRGIAVDSGGNAYVAGYTQAKDFPTTPGAFQPRWNSSGVFELANAFVSKINSTGSALEYSTYLGGSAGSAGDGVAVDSSNCAYVVGTTEASDFPTTPGAFQTKLGGYGPNAFVTKLNAAGSGLVYSTYLGGSGLDEANAIAVDPLGSACIAGYTCSSDFPTRNSLRSFCGGACTGYSDAFVAKLNAGGTGLIYSTYLGGGGGDYINALALDESGNVYATGWTFSPDFPVVHPIPGAFSGQAVDYQHYKAFVAEINAPGSALLFSTYLGGNGQDTGLGIAVDSSDRIYVAGSTSSTDFPMVNPIQPVSGGSGFVTRIVPGPPAASVLPAAVSNGWPIKKYAFNDAGTVVFTGGEFLNYADGIVYSSRNRFFKIVGVGEAVPGVAGSLFGGFSNLALTQADDVVFAARGVPCSSVAQLTTCLAMGSRVFNGLFRYSNGQISRIALGGDSVPGRAAFVFQSFDRIWLNNAGDIAFEASIYQTNQAADSKVGLFLYTGGQIQTIAVDYDPTPRGFPFTFVFADIVLSINNDGVIVFFVEKTNGVFRYAGGALTQLLGLGDSIPAEGPIARIYEATPNGQGDVVFHASFGSIPSQQGLFLLRRDGSVVRLMADGDFTPAGGSFSLWYQYTSLGQTITAPTPLSPRLNDSGTILFVSPIRGGEAAAGLFLYDGTRIRKVVASGEPQPDHPGSRFKFTGLADTSYVLNNSGVAVFNPGHAGLFYALGGKIVALETLGDLTPRIEGKTYAMQDPMSFLLNDSGTVAFRTRLCCGSFVDGIFLGRPLSPAIPNGSFESYGDYGLPAGWTTAWANSGRAEAVQSEGAGAAAFDGSATLRLHVEPGGGSVFVLSDATAAAVSPDTFYLLQCRMRFNFDSDSDVAFFSVIQFDNTGAAVGFDEVQGLRGESFWTWERKWLLIHTAPNAAFLRYRFGLSSSQEKYLDIDAVR